MNNSYLQPPHIRYNRVDNAVANSQGTQESIQQPPDMSLNAEPSLPQEREAQHLPPKSYAEAAEQQAPNKANGIDVKKTQELNKHSFNENGSIPVNGNVTPNGQDKGEYIGSGQDDSRLSPVRRGHKRNSSLKSNGSVQEEKDDSRSSQIFEKYHDGDGELPTIVKPSDDNEELRQDKKEAKKDELLAGRQAGAGWHRSR